MKTVEERFWSKVKKGAECWEWTGAVNKRNKGYGRLDINGKQVRAHRLSYEIHYGPIPKGMEVCHICDNPPCVRPSHLFIGTHKDNMIDAGAKGSLSHHTPIKLTETQVRAILKDTRILKEIAKDYSVTPSLVSKIKRGVVWKHVR